MIPFILEIAIKKTASEEIKFNEFEKRLIKVMSECYEIPISFLISKHGF